jgi:CSLREA domain-containing protein
MQTTRLLRPASAALGLACAVSISLGTPRAVRAANPFVVNKTGDASDRNIGDGICDSATKTGKQCTLRAAIQESNASGTYDTINFNIATTPRVIAPLSPLPPITNPALIDGYSQPGASANTNSFGNNAVLKIVLDGVNAGATANGLEAGGFKTVIKGLVVQRWGGSGLVLTGTQDQVYGCFIGTNAAGSLARANGTGITVTGNYGTIGGSLPASRNLISGNSGDGIVLNGFDSGTSGGGGFVVNNYIGTNKAGTGQLPNGHNGVNVTVPGAHIGSTGGGSGNLISGNLGYGVKVYQPDDPNGTEIQGNLIGTTANGSAELGNGGGLFIQANAVVVGGGSDGRNVISGNDSFGILVYHLVSDNVIQGNYIGTNLAGTAAIGNGSAGILTQDSDYTIVGGSDADQRNVISGNADDGITFVGGSNNQAYGNRIGTKADGTGDLGNAGDGIAVIGSLHNVIGGTGSDGNVIANNDASGVRLSTNSTDNSIEGNAITGNGAAGVEVLAPNNLVGANSIVANIGAGVHVATSATSGVRITGNQTIANTKLAIDLTGGTEDSFGVTANDAGDGDSGANKLQNFPILSSAIRSNQTALTTIAGSLNSTASTQFRIELFLTVADGSGHGEGQVLLAAQNITTNSSGNKSFSFTLSGLAPGHVLSATATAVTAESTSEFSANVTVAVGP